MKNKYKNHNKISDGSKFVMKDIETEFIHVDIHKKVIANEHFKIAYGNCEVCNERNKKCIFFNYFFTIRRKFDIPIDKVLNNNSLWNLTNFSS